MSKLTTKHAKAMRAAGRWGVVPDGMDASSTTVYDLVDRGYLESSPRNSRVYIPTVRGRKLLEMLDPGVSYRYP